MKLAFDNFIWCVIKICAQCTMIKKKLKKLQLIG